MAVLWTSTVDVNRDAHLCVLNQYVLDGVVSGPA